jgi:hypothetical protein
MPAADVARTALGVLDLDVDRLVRRALGLAARGRSELELPQGRHLTCDSVHGEKVGAVGCGLELDHDVL